MTKLLVLGGARSGKSRYAQARAESLVHTSNLKPIYIATAQAFDDEMEERIAHHQADRGPEWSTIEAPLNLPEAIRKAAKQDCVILVDCLTLWASNLLLVDADIPLATRELTSAITQAGSPIILVSNEVGWGIVPENALARKFSDIAGRINQDVSFASSEVQLIVAGNSLKLK